MFTANDYINTYNQVFEVRKYGCRLDRSSLALLDVRSQEQEETTPLVSFDQPTYQRMSPVMGNFLGQDSNQDNHFNATYSDTRMGHASPVYPEGDTIVTTLLTAADIAVIYHLGGQATLVEGHLCVDLVRDISTYQQQCEFRRTHEPHYIMPDHDDMLQLDMLKRKMLPWTKFYVKPDAIKVDTLSKLLGRRQVMKASTRSLAESHEQSHPPTEIRVGDAPPQKPFLGLDVSRRRPLKKDPYDLR